MRTILWSVVACASLGCGSPTTDPSSTDALHLGDSPTGDGQCVPDCHEKSCGPDGCGGTCPDTCDGICDPFTGLCSSDKCTPNCRDKACGDDGCGGECPDICEGVCDQNTGVCDSETKVAEGCTGENDTHVHTFQNIANSATSCMEESGGNPSEATLCLSNETGLSKTCMACWDSLYHCVMDSCETLCAETMTEDCIVCTHSQCGSAFKECAGVPLPWT